MSTPANADPSGTFRQAHEYGFGGLSTLDPSAKGRVLQITEKIMSRLVRQDADGKPAPDLALSWEADDSATIWTLHLRPNVTFHDGTPFDAGDVLYSFDRILDPESDRPARSVLKLVDGIEAVDDLTVQITLKSGFADFPLQLLDSRLRIIPEGSGDEIGRTGIGTGPFRIEKFDPDGISILTANPDYWEGAPGLAQIEVIGIPDGEARLLAFLAGQLDMERGVDPSLRMVMSDSGEYQVQSIPTGNWIGIAMRTDVPPFDDVRVRRAVRLAVDRKELMTLALGDGGIISCDTPVAPNDQYRVDRQCPRDLAQARSLLKEAGYGAGLKIELHIATLEPSWPAMAVVLQDQLAEVGFDLEITKVANAGYWGQVWMKKDMVGTRWGERPADQALNEIFRSDAKWNETFFQYPEFDALLDQASQELDFKVRRDLYTQAQDFLFEQSGTLIPYHVTQLVGLSRRVSGLDPVMNDAIRWHMVTVAD